MTAAVLILAACAAAAGDRDGPEPRAVRGAVEKALPLILGSTAAYPESRDCFSCHQRGAEKPQGPPEGWAPDLAMAHERLNPEWIVKWIRDPQKVMPGTKMPSFYPGGPPDVLGGDEDAQMRALRDYIISIGLPAPSLQQIAGVGATRPNP